MPHFAQHLSSLVPASSRWAWLFGRREPSKVSPRVARTPMLVGIDGAAGRRSTFSGLSASKLAGLIATGRSATASGGVFWLAIRGQPSSTFLGRAVEFELKLG